MIAGANRLAAGLALLVLLGSVAGALALVVPAMMRRGASTAGEPVVYGLASPGLESLGGLAALELSSGRLIGRVAVGGTTQGGGWALSPDGRRAYLLDREGGEWRLSELETPILRVLRRTPLPNAISPLGTAKVVAVASDGRQVYVQTIDSLSHPGGYPQGGADAAYGIAVYDVAAGAFIGQIPLADPYRNLCGVASLFALPDGEVAVLCSGGPDTRGAVLLIAPQQGRQVGGVGVGGVGGVVSADGRRCWVVERNGRLTEVDLVTRTTTRMRDLVGGGAPNLAVPYHRPRLSTDGTRLFMLAAPRDLVGTFGSSTTVWVIDTATLDTVAEISLPAPAIDLAPLPDGRALLIGSESRDAGGGAYGEEYALRLVEVPSGRELRRWAGPIAELVVR